MALRVRLPRPAVRRARPALRVRRAWRAPWRGRAWRPGTGPSPPRPKAPDAAAPLGLRGRTGWAPSRSDRRRAPGRAPRQAATLRRPTLYHSARCHPPRSPARLRLRPRCVRRRSPRRRLGPSWLRPSSWLLRRRSPPRPRGLPPRRRSLARRMRPWGLPPPHPWPPGRRVRHPPRLPPSPQPGPSPTPRPPPSSRGRAAWRAAGSVARRRWLRSPRRRRGWPGTGDGAGTKVLGVRTAEPGKRVSSAVTPRPPSRLADGSQGRPAHYEPISTLSNDADHGRRCGSSPDCSERSTLCTAPGLPAAILP